MRHPMCGTAHSESFKKLSPPRNETRLPKQYRGNTKQPAQRGEQRTGKQPHNENNETRKNTSRNETKTPPHDNMRGEQRTGNTMTQDDWTDGTFDPVCAGFGGVTWIKKAKLTGPIMREKSKGLLDLASYLDIAHVKVASMKYAEMCGGSWWPNWDLCGFEV